FGEFGDRGIRADPLDALVHCFFYFHADLHTRAWVNGFSRQVSDLPTVKSSWTGGPIVAEAKCPLWIKSRHMECKTSCPLYPRKRTCALQLGMSAMGQKRTFIGPFRNARRKRYDGSSLSPGASMRRRDFIAGFSCVPAWPLAVRAQQSERVRRIGALMLISVEDVSA